MKNQKEIYRALADGKKLTNPLLNKGVYIYFDEEGRIVHSDKGLAKYVFSTPSDWEVYDPKKTTKVTLYRYWIKHRPSNTIFAWSGTTTWEELKEIGGKLNLPNPTKVGLPVENLELLETEVITSKEFDL
jgi:hypothetical protein